MAVIIDAIQALYPRRWFSLEQNEQLEMLMLLYPKSIPNITQAMLVRMAIMKALQRFKQEMGFSLLAQMREQHDG